MSQSRLIDPVRAQHFLQNFQGLLTQIAVDTGLAQQPVARRGVVPLLQAARNALAQAPELAQTAQLQLQQQGQPVASDVMQAVATLRVDDWIYLRDTTGYSVFMDTRQDAVAYAVRCLTTPLKELLGDSGAVIHCGLLVYDGQIIADGLVGLAAWVGPNYRRSFNAALREARASSQLFSDRILPPPPEAPAPKPGRTSRRKAKP